MRLSKIYSNNESTLHERCIGWRYIPNYAKVQLNLSITTHCQTEEDDDFGTDMRIWGQNKMNWKSGLKFDTYSLSISLSFSLSLSLSLSARACVCARACVRVCVCVYVREREREKESQLNFFSSFKYILTLFGDCDLYSS